MTKKYPKPTVTHVTRSIPSKHKHHEKKTRKTSSTEVVYLSTQGSNSTQQLNMNSENRVTSFGTVTPSKQTKLTTTDNRQKRWRNKRRGIFCWSPKACLYLTLCVLLTIIIITAVITIVLATLYSTTTTTLRPATALRWKKTGRTVAGVLGHTGTSSNQLRFPWSLAIDSFYTLYIGDRQNNRIQKYLRSASNGITIAGQANGTGGTTSASLRFPAYIHVDSMGDLYIPDTINQRVQWWPQNAASGSTLAGTLNSIGNTTNLLNNPFGVTRDPNSGTLYIADSFNHRIVSYSLHATTGVIIAGNRGAGVNRTQLWDPRQVYLDSTSNCLFIANRGANNIVRWVIGESYGTVIAGNNNGTIGNTSTSFTRPTDITFDILGNMYIADDNNHRIQFFPSGQSEGITIAGITSISGNSSEYLFYPSSMVVDNQLNLYVADQANHRIQLFERY